MSPRASIRCHLDAEGAAVPPDRWTAMVTAVPGPALEWIRESVCDIAFLLDRSSFADAWAWLSDHQGALRAVRRLHRGQPYDFTLNTPASRWTWSARPVRLLPLAATGEHGDRRDDLAEGTSASVDGGAREVDYHRAISAKELLHQELVAAGVTGLVPQIDEDGPVIGILVGPLTTDAVVSLSDLLHTAMRADYAVLTTLRGAFERHGVEVPHLSLRARRLDFGEVGIAGADRLASSLGSPAPRGNGPRRP